MDIFSSTAHTTMLNGKVTALTQGSDPTAVRVGDSNLSERKLLFIQNASPLKVCIASETSQGTEITKDNINRKGIKLASDDVIWLPVSENITVYATCITDGTNNSAELRIAELA